MEGYKSRYGERKDKSTQMKNGMIKEQRWRMKG